MEKAIISIFKGGSTVIYVLILCLVLSIPVVFIYQAVKAPEFVFDSVSITQDLENDEYLKSEGLKTRGWKKAEFSLICTAGKFSPYTYEISEFTADENEILSTAEDFRIVLDEPIFCSKDIEDSFTLSVYVKSDTADLTELAKSISFKASDFSKSFGEFSLKFEDGKAKLFG